MTYFTESDHQSLTHFADSHAIGGHDLKKTRAKLLELHYRLYPRLRDNNYDLHPYGDHALMITNTTVSSPDPQTVLTLPYFRSPEQARLVERLMGRDGIDSDTDVKLFRHPVIELRLTPKSFAVELVVSPYAWWDQQNIMGKLDIARHRDALRNGLQRIDGDFCLGFWHGAELEDMHLKTRQLVHGNNLNEWLSTFNEGQDWLRVGAWYKINDSALESRRILSEITRRISALYKIYTFLLWTSNNDFHSFYRKMNSVARPYSSAYS